MRRDMELIREILLKLEELPYDGRFHDIEVEGGTPEEIVYHIMLLREAGFIEAQNLTTMDRICWKPKRLTYSGHEFLDAARSDTVWEKAKLLALKATGTVTLEGLKIALPRALKLLIDGES